MAAGFGAGITEALLIVTPFEVVKIRLQQQTGTGKDALKYKVRHSAHWQVFWLHWFPARLEPLPGNRMCLVP